MLNSRSPDALWPALTKPNYQAAKQPCKPFADPSAPHFLKEKADEKAC
jgi:hypothetical protein